MIDEDEGEFDKAEHERAVAVPFLPVSDADGSEVAKRRAQHGEPRPVVGTEDGA